MGRFLDMIRETTADSMESNDVSAPAKEAKFAKKDLRSLSPDELAHLEITFTVPALGGDGWSLEDWVRWADERSAILEFDGGLERATADNRAMALWRPSFVVDRGILWP